MRRSRTLTRYVAREVVLYTLLGLTLIGAILLLRNLGRALDELLGAGFQASDVWAVLRVIGTMLLLYALPVSFLFGVLLAVARMASDVEIVAMRACGIGVRDLAVPILALSLACSGVTFWLARDVEPAARREMRDLLASLIARGAGLQPGRFRHFGDVLVYVDGRGGDRLHGIVVSDRSDPERPLIVFASEGRLALDANGSVTLALERGDIHLDESEALGERDVRISFERFDYALDLAELLGDNAKQRPKEMSWSDLRAAVARARGSEPSPQLPDEPIEYELDLQRRLAAPLAPALFGLIGLPIGMRRARGARAFGALWCAGIAFSYYGAQIFFASLAEQGWLSAAAARWIPVASFAALAAVLLARSRRGT
ncbi:MAG TPA: LptF/LptG family permease [Myxococcota bacterium]|jgi:lipopolysaccharide export system permease protein|nr:LptF/LptG family permease [Myxococcota bacterium]